MTDEEFKAAVVRLTSDLIAIVELLDDTRDRLRRLEAKGTEIDPGSELLRRRGD